MFGLSSIVVYPAYGVAKITREVVKKIENKPVYFFELNFISKDVKILIPRENVDCVGLRPLCSKSFLENIFKSFFSEYSGSWMDEVSLMSWNRRSKEYQLKIRKGDLIDIAKIYRDLKFIEKHKILSFGEKAILQQVEELFCEEICCVYNKEYNDIVHSIRSFTESSLRSSKSDIVNHADSFLAFVQDSSLFNFNNFLNKSTSLLK